MGESNQPRAGEERYRRFFEDAPTGNCVVSAEGRVVDCNPAFAAIFAYPSVEAALGVRLAELFAEPEPWARALEELERRGKVEKVEVPACAEDGRRLHLLVNLVAERHAGESTRFHAFFLDDTERHRAAERLRLASRLEAVGQLAGGIAHDFNNLLTAVSGYSELLLDRLAPADPMRRELIEIHRAGERAADLTRQLLAFSRIQVLQPRRLDLNAVVREAASMLQRLIGADVELVLDLEPALGTVEADPGQLHQVILNLAVNARDAMPDGGTLTVATDELVLDQPDRSHPEVAIPAGRWVRLRVTDTGVGMDEETRARVFEPFFTTKEPGKGTGLGLATVYGIVKQSGGFIWPYGEPGLGATFKIYLPRVEGAADPVPRRIEAPAAEPAAAGVLVAEDSPGVRTLIREILDSRGFSVHEAENGEAALAVLRGSAPLDLVISDVVMPDLQGPELERLAAGLRPGLRFLFISGYTGETVGRQGALPPGAPLLEKPFGAAALLAKVEEVLAAPPAPQAGRSDPVRR